MKKESTPDKEDDARTAEILIDPTVSAAITIKAHTPGADNLCITAIISELKKQIDSAHVRDIKRSESLLLSQATVLDSIFNSYMLKAAKCEKPEAMKVYMTLGLRAQSQARMNLEALSDIQNPKPFIQNNKLINNAPMPRAGEISISGNKLLEDKSNEQPRLDTRETQEAVTVTEENSDL